MATAVPTSGNDIIFATQEGETIDGLGGNDVLGSIYPNTTLIGNDGNDAVRISTKSNDYNVSVFGDDEGGIVSGNDLIITRLEGGFVQQELDGGPGSDGIFSSVKADGFFGNAYGGGGGDVIVMNVALRTAESLAGFRLEGEDGNDALFARIVAEDGGSAYIGMFGGEGEDLLTATVADGVSGAARLVGEDDDDRLYVSGGGLDSDNPNNLEGGHGSDRMTGSRNSDVFTFREFTEDNEPGAEMADRVQDLDVITNFQSGTDKIALPDGALDVTGSKLTFQGLQLTLDGDGDQLLLSNVFSIDESDFIIVG